ncbi:MAG: glycosyltransferase family 9 protein [Candidatus Omnitrophica bacterium]|nr:glycosyltransferase family 9 protein [Candidatus Omnitrophota bacterium]
MTPKILVNFPTNIGDAIMALPALDSVKANFPESKVTAILSPNTKEFLSRHKFIDEFVVYNKHCRIREKVGYAFSLRKGGYQLMLDFKNSLFPLILGVKQRTPFIRMYPERMPLKERYIRLVKRFIKTDKVERGGFILDEGEKKNWHLDEFEGSVFVAAVSKSFLKTYPVKQLKTIIDTICRRKKVVLLGDENSKDYYQQIDSKNNVVDLSGKTSLLDVYYLLKNCASLCLCVDSAILHLASYVDVPIAALFGPTDICKFGPWSRKYKVLAREDLKCRPCGRGSCSYKQVCMDIEAEKILAAIAELMADKE